MQTNFRMLLLQTKKRWVPLAQKRHRLQRNIEKRNKRKAKKESGSKKSGACAFSTQIWVAFEGSQIVVQHSNGFLRTKNGRVVLLGHLCKTFDVINLAAKHFCKCRQGGSLALGCFFGNCVEVGREEDLLLQTGLTSWACAAVGGTSGQSKGLVARSIQSDCQNLHQLAALLSRRFKDDGSQTASCQSVCSSVS